MSGRELRFYYPLPRFPGVSVTGSRCELQCAHCRGHYLGQMVDVSTPDKLKQFCEAHVAAGGTGLLVSGGSTATGRVPLEGFLDVLRWVKDNTDLILNVHTGILDFVEAEEVASTGLDVASVDLVGSEDTLRRVYGLDISVEEYLGTLTNLKDAGVPCLAPHICVGLDHGEVGGERHALEYAAELDPEIIVILGLIPTPGTPMAHVPPPSPEEVEGLIRMSRSISPRSEVALGCMRSRGYKRELEWRAIEAGAQRIASASRSTVRRASDMGYRILRLEGCCAVPRSLEHRL